MTRYFAGEPGPALDLLRSWIEAGARGPDAWSARGRVVLQTLSENESESSLASCARALLEMLKPA